MFALIAVLVAASVGVVGVSGQAVSAQPRWVVRDLGSSSWAVAINERGQIAGWDFFWSNGRMTKLPTLGGWRVTATAVNGRAQVVGNSVTGRDARMPLKPHAFMWENGTMLDLTPAAHPNARAIAINDRGQIVGYGGTSIRNEDGYPVKAAFLWQSGRLKDLRRLPGATDSTAYAINGRGQIVGWSDNHAILWQDDAMRDLGTLPRERFSRAVAINGHGQIVGWSRRSWSSDPHGVLWSAGKTIDLGRGAAFAINERGQIMGNGYFWERGRRTTVDIVHESAMNDRAQIVGQSNDSAVIWENGHTTILPSLGGKESWALDINNRGQIVGWATTPLGKQRGVLWTLQP